MFSAKRLLTITFCIASFALQTGCETMSGPVTCPTAVNNAQYGFSLTVPCNFGGTTSLNTLAAALLQQSYRQDNPGLRLNVFVLPDSGNTGSQAGVTTEDLGNTTNSAGVAFARLKVTVNGIPGYTIGAGTPLSGGTNQLLIQISGLDNEDAARTVLATVVGSVRVN